MFVDFRKRGREGERERNFSLLPGAHTPTGDQTQNLGMCPEGVKPTTFSSAGRHSTNWTPPRPRPPQGPTRLLYNKSPMSYHPSSKISISISKGQDCFKSITTKFLNTVKNFRISQCLRFSVDSYICLQTNGKINFHCLSQETDTGVLGTPTTRYMVWGCLCGNISCYWWLWPRFLILLGVCKRGLVLILLFLLHLPGVLF